ncbi:MAG: hypothetical protein LYZ66_04195 [Nitrososphaerales archaeon]|nr:hypothetical protein [Nitrososphaerales archaeon]
MSKLSVGKKTVTYAATAALVSALIIVASTLYLGFPTIPQPQSSGSSSTSGLAGPQSLLVVQLTDPPQVPSGTKSLNLSYSSLSLLVGEPSSGGKLTTTTVNVTPTGGSAAFNLLKLQNVSVTIASANLPNGSIIYSVTFTVSSLMINVNGTILPVTLATGGSTFTVTIAQPSALQGTNVALLQLNPIVVGTPTGYQLIPSAVGVVRHSQGGGEEQVGSQHQLNQQDNGDLENARGNVTANLSTLSVSGNSTSVTVQVRNTGNGTVMLNAIGLHGNFTTSGTGCTSKTSTTRTSTSTNTETSHGSSTHSQTHTSENQGGHQECEVPEHMNEVVFVPVVPTASATSTTASTTATTTASTTTSAACTSAQMKLVNGDSGDEGNGRGFALSPGQCINLTFTGTITFGESGNVLVPSTAAGQSYDVHIIASSGANLQLSCVLPLGAASCKVETQSQSEGND